MDAWGQSGPPWWSLAGIGKTLADSWRAWRMWDGRKASLMMLPFVVGIVLPVVAVLHGLGLLWAFEIAIVVVSMWAAAVGIGILAMAIWVEFVLTLVRLSCRMGQWYDTRFPANA